MIIPLFYLDKERVVIKSVKPNKSESAQTDLLVVFSTKMNYDTHKKHLSIHNKYTQDNYQDLHVIVHNAYYWLQHAP